MQGLLITCHTILCLSFYNAANAYPKTPSSAPSFPPTAAPSRYPTTSGEYDSFFRITYAIKYLEDEYTQILVQNIFEVWDKMSEIIEQSYFEATALKYRFFNFEIEDLLTYQRNEINQEQYQIFVDAQNDGILIHCNIECSKYACKILTKYNKFQDEFELIGTAKFRKYFVNFASNVNAQSEEFQFESQLIFEIKSYGKVDALYGASEEIDIPLSVNKVLIFLFSIVIIMFIVSLLAFIHSKVKQIDCIWYGSMIYALQFVLLISDINVCIELVSNGFRIYALSCFVSVLIAYYFNIYFGGKITRMIPEENESAILFFKNRNKLFMILIAISGGCYPVLFLLSSNIFALEYFNSGLVNYELKKMSKMKIIYTICLQNIPQIFIQCLYSAAIGVISANIAFAFVISVLSIICTPFVINNVNFTHFAYCLELKIINEDNDDDVHNKFVSNKGKTQQIAMILCGVFDADHKIIEISRNVRVGTVSIRLYVLHFVSNSNMDLNGIIKLYSKKENINILTKEFKKLFDFNRECMIITFKSLDGIHGKNEIVFDQNKKNNQPQFERFDDLLKKLMDAKGLNYGLMSDKRKFLSTYSTLNDEGASNVELQSIQQNDTIDMTQEPEQKINVDNEEQDTDDSQSDLPFHV